MQTLLDLNNFYASGRLRGDFIISTKRNKYFDQLMSELKFLKIAFKNFDLFYLGFNYADKGDILFSGYCFNDDHTILKGPAVLNSNKIRGDIGEFYSLNISYNQVELNYDFFGLYPIYYGHGLVSNRLHLIFLALKSIYGRVIFDKGNLFSDFLIDNSFNQQLCTFQTILKGVKKLQRGKSIVVLDGAGIKTFDCRTKYHDEFILSECDYFELIKQGASEIVNNLTCILNTYNNPICALTAGLDSRVIYSALVAMGKCNSVRFTTSPAADDQEIASGLIKKFGGKYISPDEYNFHEIIINDKDFLIKRFISHYFFTKSNLPNFYLNEEISSYAFNTALIGGYCGEVYRDFYSETGFPIDNNESSFDCRKLLDFFKKDFKYPDDFSFVENNVINTFNALPGNSYQQKMRQHYCEFRNTYHFGTRYSRTNQIDFAPILSKSLYLASTCLPFNIRRTGRVLYDVTCCLCDELAHCKYGKYSLPSQYNYAKLPYHKRSPFDTKSFINIDPCKSIIITKRHLLDSYLEQLNTLTIADYRKNLLQSSLDELNRVGLNKRFINNNINSKISYIVKKNSSNSIDRYISAFLKILFVHSSDSFILE